MALLRRGHTGRVPQLLHRQLTDDRLALLPLSEVAAWGSHPELSRAGVCGRGLHVTKSEEPGHIVISGPALLLCFL